MALTPEWVQQFEQSLDLNEVLRNDRSYRDTVSITSYARYYLTGVVDGVAYITALYVIPFEPERPGVHIGGSAPLIFDGGCEVIALGIDPETHRVVTARCNGMA